MNLIAQRCQQYLRLMRFDRPIGFALLLWPTLWALWIAAKGIPPWLILTVFVFGVILMRAAGCVINDISDRNFDKHVSRTQNRPLALAKVSVTEAVVLFATLCLIAFVLVLQLNLYTILLSVIALALAAFYPLTKRYTYWPQFFLGLAFAWGIPMAFAAQINQIPLIAWLIFLINMLWVIVYDTQYAMVDRDDDVKIGIKSTAILFGRYDVGIISLLQIIVISLLLWLGWLLSFNLWYYFTIMLASFLFIYQQRLIRHRQPAACFKAFLNNNYVGLLIFIGIFLNYLRI